MSIANVCFDIAEKNSSGTEEIVLVTPPLEYAWVRSQTFHLNVSMVLRQCYLMTCLVNHGAVSQTIDAYFTQACIHHKPLDSAAVIGNE